MSYYYYYYYLKALSSSCWLAEWLRDRKDGRMSKQASKQARIKATRSSQEAADIILIFSLSRSSHGQHRDERADKITHERASERL
jgi:hypothetical protein